MENQFKNLAKNSYLNLELSRPDWTIDSSRDESLLWMNKNENIDPILNEKIHSLLKQMNPLSINTYPEMAKFYKKLSVKVGLSSPSCLLLTHGSDGAIRTIFDVFISTHDKVLHTQPTFAMYDIYSKMFGAKQVIINYEVDNYNFTLNPEKLFNGILEEKPKLVCLPNPDSPTGTVLSKTQMQKLIECTRDAGSLLLIDEAYYPFYEDTVIHEVENNEHLFVCRSFSKAWGAAGLRVGYIAGNQELISLLHKNRPMYELSTFSSELINLLLDCEGDVHASVQRLEEGRVYFVQAMKEMGFPTSKSYGNFLHVHFGNDHKKISEALKDVVLFRTEFGIGSVMNGFSRFSLGTKEQFELVVNVIKKSICTH